MMKAWHLVENYQQKYVEPEKFLSYRDKRRRELEKEFIKEHLKKDSSTAKHKPGVVIAENTTDDDDQTT